MAKAHTPENPIVIFLHNGTEARVIECDRYGTNERGEKMLRFVLFTSQDFRDINEILDKELEDGYFIFDVPEKVVLTNNPFGTANRVFAILVTVRKELTHLTKYLACPMCGSKEYHDNIFDDMRTMESVIKSQQIKIANLREENRNISKSTEIELSEKSKEDLSDEISKKVARKIYGERQIEEQH